MNLVTKRLLPLYIGSLFQGAALWYAIEKLFMTDIGFTTFTIGVMVSVMSAVVIVVETPSGILADRWSRKGVMILGCVALLLAAITGGLSNSVWMYIFSTCFWGVYNAFYSGTYESVIYDTVIEETGSSDLYNRQLSLLRVIEGVAFVIGAIVGGLIATNIEIRDTYFLSIPILTIGMVCLFFLKEPTLHKLEAATPLFAHVTKTFKIILRRRALLPLITAIVGIAIVQDTLFELSQLWFLALAMPVGLYGIASAILFSTWTTGGFVSRFMNTQRIRYVGAILVLAPLLVLIFSRSYTLIIGAQFMLGTILVSYSVIMSKALHDTLPSSLRAGAASVVSTVGHVLLVPGSLVFGAIAQNYSIFSATYILLIAAVIALTAFVLAGRIDYRISKAAV